MPDRDFFRNATKQAVLVRVLSSISAKSCADSFVILRLFCLTPTTGEIPRACSLLSWIGAGDRRRREFGKVDFSLLVEFICEGSSSGLGPSVLESLWTTRTIEAPASRATCTINPRFGQVDPGHTIKQEVHFPAAADAPGGNLRFGG
jgi:hypothetical protein